MPSTEVDGKREEDIDILKTKGIERNFTFPTQFSSNNFRVFEKYVSLQRVLTPIREWEPDIYIKAFTRRFGFDCLRTSQLPTVRQKQSSGECPVGCIYILPVLLLLIEKEAGRLYNSHRRGVFSVARFDEQGNAKAFKQWNGRQDWLHVFYAIRYYLDQ